MWNVGPWYIQVLNDFSFILVRKMEGGGTKMGMSLIH